MNINSLLIFTATIAFPVGVLAQDQSDNRKQAMLKWSLGAGVVSAPSYKGDDDYQASIFPNVTISYGGRIKASLRGIEYIAFVRDGWNAGVVLAYDRGRDERPDNNPFAITDNASNDLVGLGDIDGTVQLGGFWEYKTRSFGAKIELHQGVDGGHDGLEGEVSINYRGKLTATGRSVFFSIGPAIAFGDDAYNSTFFDVSASQSTASGIGQYNAEGGVYSFGVHASTMMPLTKNIAVVGIAEYDQLAGDVGDSTIVSERGSKDQITAGVFINYRF
ncbi:MAG: MipA/OmpV family protein [Granulosicoccus sp.]